MAKQIMRKVKLPAVAVSLGGVESMILSYPVTMSHAVIEPQITQELGIGDGLCICQ